MASMIDPAPALQSPVGAEHPTLLIVDDSRLMRHALKKILSADFNLVEAADGEEAWVKLQAEPGIQAIFSDLSMPNLDGYGLLERVRKSAEARINSLPFIVITGKEGDDTSLRAEAQALGANEIVCKPFKSEEIIGMTNRFLVTDEQGGTETEALRLAEEAEAQRHAEKTARLAAEEEARRIAAEAEAQRQAEESARLAVEADAQRLAEETARITAEAEARRIAAEAEVQRQAEESARHAAEAEAQRIAEEAQAQRLAEETARVAAEAEARRIAAEVEAQRQAAEAARATAEQEARRIAEETEAQRLAEETARVSTEADAQRAAEAASQQPVQEELFAGEALEGAQLAVKDTTEQAANDTESDYANAAVAEAASYTELPDTDDDLFDTAAAEPQRFPLLTRTCIRLALPFMRLANRLLRLNKDKQLARLRERL